MSDLINTLMDNWWTASSTNQHAASIVEGSGNAEPGRFLAALQSEFEIGIITPELRQPFTKRYRGLIPVLTQQASSIR
ncbi:MAG: hypothetical protein IPK64_22395 [bacterium]|nr:hypothetical protein [bacterium]